MSFTLSFCNWFRSLQVVNLTWDAVAKSAKRKTPRKEVEGSIPAPGTHCPLVGLVSV